MRGARLSLTHFPSERRLAATLAACRDIASGAAALRPARRPARAPGPGRTVLVLPGFLTGDWATGSLVAWLRALGHDARGWGPGLNAGPTAAALARCRALLDGLGGEPVVLIGVSLGGLYARELARERPDRVRRVLTFGTPVRFPVATPLAPFARLLERGFDPALLARAGDLARNPPVPLTAVHSRRDAIVPWRACLVDEGPLAENIGIETPHTIMSSTPAARRIIADRLTR